MRIMELEILGYFSYPPANDYPVSPKIPRTDTTPPLHNLVLILRPHLTWNAELKILDYLECVLAYDLRNSTYIPQIVSMSQSNYSSKLVA